MGSRKGEKESSGSAAMGVPERQTVHASASRSVWYSLGSKRLMRIDTYGDHAACSVRRVHLWGRRLLDDQIIDEVQALGACGGDGVAILDPESSPGGLEDRDVDGYHHPFFEHAVLGGTEESAHRRCCPPASHTPRSPGH